MIEFGSWNIKYWPGGWVRALDDEAGTVIVLHYVPVDHGDDLILRLHATLMASSRPITARQWRDAPLTKIEQNFSIWNRAKLEEFAQEPAPDDGAVFSLDQVLKYFEETPPLPLDHQLTVAHRIPDERPEEVFERLRRPADRRISDEFLHDIAIVYRWLVAQGNDAPANMLARGASAPVGTVHRWIAQARRRGFLPPAVRGKAG